MYVTHDRELIDRSHRGVVSGWLAFVPLVGELSLLVGTLASWRRALVRWSSQVLGRGIHVSPMSGTWLRIHTAEHPKHGADL
jgi:hypothetical protein